MIICVILIYIIQYILLLHILIQEIPLQFMQTPPGRSDLEVFLTIMLNTTLCNISTCIDSLTCEGTRLQDPVGEVTGYWPLACSVSTANVNREGSCLFTPSPASDRESRGPGSRIDMDDRLACKVVPHRPIWFCLEMWRKSYQLSLMLVNS